MEHHYYSVRHLTFIIQIIKYRYYSNLVLVAYAAINQIYYYK